MLHVPESRGPEARGQVVCGDQGPGKGRHQPFHVSLWPGALVPPSPPPTSRLPYCMFSITAGSGGLMRGRKSSPGLLPMAARLQPLSLGPLCHRPKPGPLQGCEATSSRGPGSSLRGPLQCVWGGSLLSGLLARGFHSGSPLQGTGPPGGPGRWSWAGVLAGFCASESGALSEMALLSQFCGCDAAALAGPTDSPNRSAGAASQGCLL